MEINKIEKMKTKQKIEEIFRTMAAKAMNPQKIADELGYESITIYSKLRQEGFYTRTQVIKLLEEKSDEEISRDGRIELEVVRTIRKEIEEQGEKFRTMAAKVIDPKKIADELGYIQVSSIYSKLKQEGFYTRTQVIKLLGKKRDEEISREGKIELDVVKAIRKEIEEQEEKLRIMAAKVIDPQKIAEELGYVTCTIYSKLRQEGFYTRAQVIKLLGEKSDEEISRDGKIDLDVVKSIRKEIEEKDQKQQKQKEKSREMHSMSRDTTMAQISKKLGYANHTPIYRKLEKEGTNLLGKNTQYNIIMNMGRRLETPKRIEEKTGISKYEIILMLRKNEIPTRFELEKLIFERKLSDSEIANMFNGINKDTIARIRQNAKIRKQLMNSIPDDKKKEIKRQIGLPVVSAKNIVLKLKLPELVVKAFIEQQDIDEDFNIPETDKKEQFMKEWNEFRIKVESKLVNQSYEKLLVHRRICKMIAVYQELLQQSHYAYIAYAYLKAKEYLKGIEIGEQYLQLEESSIEGLSQKINEILELKNKQEVYDTIGGER